MTPGANGRRAARAPKPSRLAPPLLEPGDAYFFDIDGTLVEFADSPGGVRLDAARRRLIEELSRATGGAVALISGRPIAEIDRLFPGVRMPAAGQHGIERRDAAGRVTSHTFPAARLAPVRRQLALAVARHPRLVLEDKGISLALHYRRAPNLGSYAHRLVRGLQSALGPEYCLQPGKRVVELKPVGKHKGIAVQEFMREAPFAGRTPVFVGDDVTDEYGFAVVNRRGGHTVKVGPGRTVARARLRSVGAVWAWIEQGLEAMREQRRASEGG